MVQGEALTISVWTAPRAFEWDDPNAAANGTEHLTAIAGQYSKEKKQGFLLGYQRYGRLCFQVGTGAEWLTLWADGGNLHKVFSCLIPPKIKKSYAISPFKR